MSYTPTNWTDHIKSSSAFNISKNADGTYNITPAGEVVQQGTPISAENLNNMEQGIVEAVSENAINKTTLGYSGKNLFNPNAVNWYQPTKISIANDGTITSTVTSDSRSWGLANAEYFLTLQAGKYIIKIITESLDDIVTVNENIRGYNEAGTQIINIFPNIIGTQVQKFTITETNSIGFMFKIMTQACKIMIYNADITDSTYEPYVEPVDERITSNNSDIAINKSTLGYTKKNLLPPTNSVTRAGITYAVSGDGKVTLVGINTSTSYNYFSIPVTLESGKYIVSGMPSGGSDNTYRVDLRSGASGGTVFGYGTAPFEVEFSETTTVYYMIRIDASYTSELNLTFEPMIRLAEITDPTYEPYIESVDKRIANNDSDISVNKGTLGCQKKNLLKNILTTRTESGVTFTVNDDKSITVNGTATATIWRAIGQTQGVNFRKERLIFSGNPSGTGAGEGLEAWYLNNTTGNKYLSIANGLILKESNYDSSGSIVYQFHINSGKTYDNVTFYPMLRHADIIDDTYEPYVPDINTRLLALEDKHALSGQLLAGTSFGKASGSITINNLASYSAVWAYIDGNVSGINFAVNVIIPIAYLAKSTSNSVKLAGGIPSDAYITSSGPQAPKDTSGYITASVSENVLKLELSGSGNIGNVEIVSM